MSIYMRFDEEALKAIAQATSAEYFHAGSGADLKKVSETLNARYVLEKKETEVSSLLCALAAALILVAVGLSVLWFGRFGAPATGGTRAGWGRLALAWRNARETPRGSELYGVRGGVDDVTESVPSRGIAMGRPARRGAVPEQAHTLDRAVPPGGGGRSRRTRCSPTVVAGIGTAGRRRESARSGPGDCRRYSRGGR